MSQVSCSRPRTAAWRLLLACMLVASVALAPVAQAVCAIEHLASVITDDNGTTRDNGDSGTPTDDRDACCDEGATALTADTDRTADMLAAHAAAFVAVMPAPHSLVLPNAWARRHAAQCASPPPEPVLLRLPKLLI